MELNVQTQRLVKRLLLLHDGQNLMRRDTPQLKSPPSTGCMYVCTMKAINMKCQVINPNENNEKKNAG